MPVKRRSIGNGDVGPFRALAEELASELAFPKEFGQPLVDEEAFARTGLVGVTVIWDKWKNVPELKRPDIILEAYSTVQGEGSKDRIAFAIGMTLDEAVEAGRLPYSILPLGRVDDGNRATIKAVMLEFGGVPTNGDYPAILYFPTLIDAEACREKLIERVPGTESLWGVVATASRPEWAV